MIFFFLLALSQPEIGVRLSIIYAKYRKMLLNIAYSALRDKSYAEDCVQDVFLRLMKYWDSFNETEEENVPAYLAKTCYNCAHDINSKLHLNNEFSLPEALPEEAQARLFADKLTESEEAEIIAEKIRSLDVKYAYPLVMRYFGNMSYKAIAEKLGANVNTVKSRVFRAKKMLLDDAAAGEENDE